MRYPCKIDNIFLSLFLLFTEKLATPQESVKIAKTCYALRIGWFFSKKKKTSLDKVEITLEKPPLVRHPEALRIMRDILCLIKIVPTRILFYQDSCSRPPTSRFISPTKILSHQYSFLTSSYENLCGRNFSFKVYSKDLFVVFKLISKKKSFCQIYLIKKSSP